MPASFSVLNDLSPDERRELAWALLARPKRSLDGFEALRRKYPSVPEEMVHTAAHHLYEDGPDAVVAFLAEAELAIRDRSYEIGYGATSELLYHVYNWLQFRAILPEGKTDLLALLAQMEQAVKDDDRELIVGTVEELREVLNGDRSPPDVGVL